MSGPLGSQQWMYASGGFYPFSIDQSLRFNDDDSAYLSRTPASTGNRKTWTWSGWIKRGNLGTNQNFFDSSNGAGTVRCFLRFNSSNQIYGQLNGSTASITTTPVYRDCSSWYHIVWYLDTTQATASDRMKLYVNGVQVTDGTFNYPTQNSDQELNIGLQPFNIGRYANGSEYFDGYMAEVNFIDGTALDPTSFGETINGIWVPKQYSGSYGTNGFYLSFADSAAIGDDLSGNTNDFTANNLAASDVVPDSPTNNFSTLNRLKKNNTTQTFAEGNLDFSSTQTGTNPACTSTFAVTSGKWYWEVYIRTDAGSNSVGIAKNPNNLENDSYALYNSADSYQYQTDGNKRNNSSSTSYGDAWTTGDIIGVALDLDAGAVYFYKNGTIQNSGTAAYTSLSGEFTSYSLVYQGGAQVYNFGQDDSFANNKTSGSAADSDSDGLGTFYHSVPSGYKALCSANLPEPAIGPNSTTTSDEHFNTVLYTGDGTNGQAITGVGHQPDFLWIKSRSGTAYHELHDSVRGAGTRLFSNDTAAESTVGTVSSFDSDGFTVSRNSAYDGTNQSGVSFVGWNWKAGGTAVSNTDGSITTSVSTNTDAGISIIKYTGNGTSSATIGHNLGVTPDHIIIKRTSSAEAWVNWHKGFTATQYLRLYQTNAVDTATTLFNSTLPSSSVITLGNGGFVNTLSEDYICYAFAEKEGFSKFGTYVGNANANGPFVYTGFRPAFVLLKVSSAVNNWFIYDNKREGYNQDNDTLSPNLTTVEDTSYKLDLVSNGFKIRGSNNAHNQSGQTFIYLAFAEAPFKYANAR